MIKTQKRLLVGCILALAWSLSTNAQVQRPYNASDFQVRTVLNRVVSRSNTFRIDLNSWISNSRIDGTRAEDSVRLFSDDFQSSLTRLRSNFNRRQSTTADVQDLIDRAARIDSFLIRRQADARTLRDWNELKSDLNTLASYYSVSWRPYGDTVGPDNSYPNYPNNSGYGNQRPYFNNRITGTYSLNRSQSDDPRVIADRAGRSVPYNNRQSVLDRLNRRLDSPDQIAIDRQGSSVTIASTRAPQITFLADGRENIETGPNGRTIHARASFIGDRLTVTTSGDRESDFTVTFEPIDNGRRLAVTRVLNSSSLNAPVTVRSIYDRTADIAQLNIYNGNGTVADYRDNNAAINGDFVIPNDTRLVGILNNDISTSRVRNNDRFSMRVTAPAEYRDAVVEGYVTGVERSGRITGRSSITLNFDRIRLRDGRSYRFAGYLESVRTMNGEDVRVNNEGAVAERDNRTPTTTERAAIGTAVGALIGAIAGGGKGAAIGAIVGAGAGAGSVYVEGRDDLDLLSGTEITLRATGQQ
jgi:hypothetical protein